MNIPLRNQRKRTVVGGAVLALAFGGLTAAPAARASAASSTANSVVSGITFYPEVTDSLNPSGVTAPDAILTCATSRITISGLDSITIPVGCLTLYNGEWIKVTWASPEMPASEAQSTQLTQQTDGNLVVTFTSGLLGTSPATEWSSGTTFAGNANGPGCLAQFTSSGDLTIYQSSAGTALWTS